MRQRSRRDPQIPPHSRTCEPARPRPRRAAAALAVALLTAAAVPALAAGAAHAAGGSAAPPTALTAGTATLTRLPLGESDLNATLTGDGVPIAGQKITFTDTTGEFLCGATTDNAGRAACSTSPGLLDSVGVLLGGYTATFAGSTYYLPSCAHGDTALL